MSIKRVKGATNGTRNMSKLDFAELTTNQREKTLTKGMSKHAGRNNQGKETMRSQGGGHKRKYRLIDFKREKDGIPGRVASIEYDPNRTANIALIHYADGEKRYILAPKGLQIGQIIEYGEDADIRVGNALPLGNIPVGTNDHIVVLKPDRGCQLNR